MGMALSVSVEQTRHPRGRNRSLDRDATVTAVGHAPGEIDISVLAPCERLTPTPPSPSSQFDLPLAAL